MKFKNPVLIIILPALLFSPVAVYAADENVAVSLGRMNFDYEETDIDGTFLDGEYGDIYGFSIDYSRNLRNNMLARFSLEYFRGVVDYDGHLQSALDPPDLNVQMFPFKSETEETVLTLSAYLAGQIIPSIKGLSIYGKFSYKNWGRDIQGRFVSENGNLGTPINEVVPNLYEEYSWWQLNAGLHYRLDIASVSWLEFFAGFLQTLNPTMEIGSYELDLGEKQGYEFGAAWFFNIAPHKRLGISSSVSHWEFGRSNTIQTGFNDFILEPDSESLMKTIKVTFEWDLKKR